MKSKIVGNDKSCIGLTLFGAVLIEISEIA
jgi:hypothetical protein